MSEPKLSQRQLVLIRRAAEDAIHACNRHYGPFVDVVAHPLNICALVDMAQMNIGHQEKMDGLTKLLSIALGDLNVAKKNLRDRYAAFQLVREEIEGLQKSLNTLSQKFKQDAHASSQLGDLSTSRIYNAIANQLDQLVKGCEK